MLKFYIKISIRIISVILTQVFLWASTGYPINNLRVPLDVTEQRIAEAMITEKIKAQLADVIADTVGQPREEVAQTLGQLAPEVLHQAWSRRFNFDSEFFKERFVKLWQNDSNERGDDLEKSDALYLLAEGYIVSQKLGPRGECIINFNTMGKPEFVKELSPWLRGKRIYMNPKRNNAHVSIEWAWVPVLNQWLPVQLDSTILKTLFENDGTIIKIGARNSGRKELKKFYEHYGKGYKLCMRVGSGGHFYIGYEKVKPSGHNRGSYEKPDAAGKTVIGTIGQNGVPIEFFFIGDDAPVYPKIMFKKSSSGKIELIESHLADTLSALTAEYGSFWILFQTSVERPKIGSKVITGKLAADRPRWVDSYLEINPDGKTYTLSIIHSLKLSAKETTVQILIIGGVPAYAQRGEQRLILKRLEAIPKDTFLPRDPIDSFVEDISSEALLKSLAHASQNNLNIVATGLIGRKVDSIKGSKWIIGVAGQRIHVPPGLVSQDPRYAEVVYDPADVVSERGQMTPRPVEVRVGFYTTDDPDKLSERRFVIQDTFSLAEHENSPGTFIAYKKHVQLDLKAMPRTDI